MTLPERPAKPNAPAKIHPRTDRQRADTVGRVGPLPIGWALAVHGSPYFVHTSEHFVHTSASPTPKFMTTSPMCGRNIVNVRPGGGAADGIAAFTTRRFGVNEQQWQGAEPSPNPVAARPSRAIRWSGRRVERSERTDVLARPPWCWSTARRRRVRIRSLSSTGAVDEVLARRLHHRARLGPTC
jgi:hypothetical protein